jgi:tetratricopeptide (TPR) repeat protein
VRPSFEPPYRGLAPLVLAVFVGSSAFATGPSEATQRAMAEAEARLKDGELQTAESSYRAALLEGWLLLGDLEGAEGRWDRAKADFERASASAVETRRPHLALALAHLQVGDTPEAVTLLTHFATSHPKDVDSRRMLAQALEANGQLDQAIQALEEAREADPKDLELAFALATEYLKVQHVALAEPLFNEIAKARPIPQTQVLIGSAYRRFDELDRAKRAFGAALKLDTRVRHAHFYLGMVALNELGLAGLDLAITEFQKELTLAPQDPAANLQIGMALVEARRPAEGLPHLELASRTPPPRAEAFYYLGRCRLELDQPLAAQTALESALALLHEGEADDFQLVGAHYQLALALRQLGKGDEAKTHFAEAERRSGKGVESDRWPLANYLSESLKTERKPVIPVSAEVSQLAELKPSERAALRAQGNSALVRAYLNLGVIEAQGQRFTQAAVLLERAAEVDPEFPKVQYSLGVAYFNAQQFEKAKAPLARALAANPFDSDLRHMLALALINTQAYDRAIALLRDDSERERDPSLEYAYGLALVRAGRAAEAQAIFARLLQAHGDSPELNVVLGEAYAQQGDYPSAIDSFERALKSKSDVRDANGALGVIYLKQGKLAEAEAALRSELKLQPGDLNSQHNLAKVLELEQKPEEALLLLSALLKAKPDFGDARYLMGKILLALGHAEDALQHLQAAARLSPGDANVHYQLGQTYRKLGQGALASDEFEIFRELKHKPKGDPP